MQRVSRPRAVRKIADQRDTRHGLWKIQKSEEGIKLKQCIGVRQKSPLPGGCWSLTLRKEKEASKIIAQAGPRDHATTAIFGTRRAIRLYFVAVQ